jgi:mono/diheme cytochrome c family protein
MNASTRIVGLGLLIAALLVTGRTSESAASPSPSPSGTASAGDAVAGKVAFTQNCSICHGVAAKGFIGPYIAGVNWTAPGLHAIVRGGIGGYGGMPAFNADAVTDKNIADIAAYLAVLPPETPPQASPSPSATAPAIVAVTTTASPTPAATASAAASVPPVIASGDPVHGHQIYSENCAACHGASAQGGVGPSLRGERNRKETAAAIAWIKHPKLPMPTLYPNPLSEKDVDDVAAYVESL